MRVRGRKLVPLYLNLLILGLLLPACSDRSESPAGISSSVLRVAPLPDQSPETLKKQYQPFLTYLQKQTGLTTRLVIADDYSHMLELFGAGEIDLANFGGVTYVQARKKYAAEALVLRDIDTLFSSVILVKARAPAKTIKDLWGKSFSFGSRLSTSGHLMPRHYLLKMGIQPEAFFASIEYSGAHDKTAYWVRDGKVYAGVANSVIVEQMFKDERLSSTEVRMLWKSPAYPDYVWAVRSGWSSENTSSVQRAFLRLRKSVPEEKAILDDLGAGYYLPANNGDFRVLERILEELESKGVP